MEKQKSRLKHVDSSLLNGILFVILYTKLFSFNKINAVSIGATNNFIWRLRDLKSPTDKNKLSTS